MNKKGFTLLSMALISASLFASEIPDQDDLYGTEKHYITPFELCLASPIQVPSSSWNVYGLRANIFYGASYRIIGLDLGLVGYCRDQFTGVALQGCNWVVGDVCGVQLGALANVYESDSVGVQMSGILNYGKGTFAGFQSSLMNINNSMYGMQVGAMNWNNGLSKGLQFGLVNASQNEFNGWSFGVINYSGVFSGAQIGLLNISNIASSGVQIGLVNAANTMSGIQIGLLNLITNSALPVLPFINGNF